MHKMFRYLLYSALLLVYCKVNARQRDTTVVLKPAADPARVKQLKTVVVTGQQNRYIEQQTDKTVVNANALASTAGSNAIDVLNNAPGVMVDETGTISLKGREGVVVYIDDKRVRLTGTDLLHYLRSLPVSMIDQIELMPNPSAAIYICRMIRFQNSMG